MFYHPHHGKDVGNPIGVLPNNLRVPMYVSNNIGSGHFCVTTNAHVYVPFWDVC